MRGWFTRVFLLALFVCVLRPVFGADAPVWLPQVNHWAGNTGGKGGIDANADVISNMICDMAVLNAGDLNEEFAKYAPLVITKSYWDETNWADGAYSAGKRVAKGEFFYKDITFDTSTFGGITATLAHPQELSDDQQGREDQGISIAAYPDNQPYVALSDGRTITTIAYPTSVAFDRDGYLWVADNGPDQNFKIFSVPATGAPTVVATFGETGGVFAGPVSGRAGPLRFWGPRGVGFGDKGEIIVGCSGIPGQVQGGTDVRWFMPSDTSSLAKRVETATLQHQARGMFLHVGDFAPGTDGTELHTESVRYTMDYSKKPGESWAFSAVTLDPFRYPDDPRAQMAFGTTYIKKIGGKKFLYCTDMYYQYLAVFRFEEGSEIAIPCAFFYCYGTNGQGAEWAKGKYPTWTDDPSGRRRYMWRDSNGDGQVDAGEFGIYTVPNSLSQSYDVDADGNIWMGGGQAEYSEYFDAGGIWVIPSTGVDAKGVPMYDLNAIEKLDVPQSLLRPEDYEISRSPTRMRYLPETDTLFLGVSQDSWRTRRIYVIDGYRHSGNPTLRCMIDTGYDNNNETEVHLDQGTVTMVLPFSFAADNEYVYVGYLTGGRNTLSRGEVTIYSATDGHQIGWLRPDADTNWFCGTVDLVVGLQVTTLADGSRLICEEDDGAGKVMVFHWDPNAPPSNAMIITTARPAALTCTRDHEGTLQLATTGGALSWSIPAIAATGGPAHGTATVSSTGLVRYTPAAGYVGLDTLIVEATNAQGVRDSIKVACTVSAPTTATVTLGGLSQTYNGSARPVTVTTVPAGLTVNVTYSGSATVPVNAGLYSVVATVADATYTGSASGTLSVAKASSTITWTSPAGITYGTALSSTQLNATASVPGTFTYTPAAGTVLHAGSAQTLQATFTPTDKVNYATATKSVTLSVAKAPLMAKATDQQRRQGTANPTLGISYTGFVNGDTAAALDTRPTASTTATTASAPGQYPITLSGGSDADYVLTLQNGTLTVMAKAVPVLTWTSPAGITYGTALSSTQLNATASVPGTFTYTPAAGTVLHAGSAQTLQATFTPTDTANYATATKSVTLSVAKAPLIAQASDQQRTLGAANPALDISYSGLVNGDTVADLDVLPTASTTATTASAAGSYPITLSGGSDGDYAFTLRDGTLTVTAKAVPVLTWTAPAGITYGTALSSTQLNATASVSGTFTYTPAAGTVLHAGSGQALQVTFTPTDTVNYAPATKSVTLSVAKAPLVAQANSQQRGQGADNLALEISYTGFVNGDTAAVLDVRPTASTTATTASTPGQYPITLSGGSDADYVFTLRDGTLTVMGIDAPKYTRAPQPATVAAGGRAVFGVTVTSTRTLTYQWQVSTDGGSTWIDVAAGQGYSGATSDELAFTARPEMSDRQFRCLVSDGINPAVASEGAALTVPWSQFAALSARAAAGTGEQTLTLGFVFAGGGKPAMVRGVGPGLLDGEPTLAGRELADPQLKVFENRSGAFELLTSNDNWGGASALSQKFAALGQGPLARDSKDAALYLETLGQRVYTAQISGVTGTGVTLAEAYDADFADKSKRLTALSVRNQVGTGSEVLIAGFVVSGDAPKRVIVRGVGPGLANDVAGYLADPQLLVHRLKADRSGWDLVGSNDNWDGTAATAALFESVGMGELDAGSKDAALVLELEPGVYTAQISGQRDTTGVALAEIYEAP